MEIETTQKVADPLRTVKDLAAGAAGGIAQVLLGMCTSSRWRANVADASPS